MVLNFGWLLVFHSPVFALSPVLAFLVTSVSMGLNICWVCMWLYHSLGVPALLQEIASSGSISPMKWVIAKVNSIESWMPCLSQVLMMPSSPPHPSLFWISFHFHGHKSNSPVLYHMIINPWFPSQGPSIPAPSHPSTIISESNHTVLNSPQYQGHLHSPATSPPPPSVSWTI